MDKYNEQKKRAAEKAAGCVRSGMIVGLGTGSTVYYALLHIAELLKKGDVKNILGIPSSVQTEKISKELGIPLTDFSKHQEIDLTIDGADEIDAELNLIKGGGGALLREKVLAQASKEFMIIADESKVSTKLGEKWAVPIEVIPFAVDVETRYLTGIGAEVSIRKSGTQIFRTDGNNFVLDANFGVIEDPESLANSLDKRAGILEHGLFINLANKAIVAGENDLRELV